MKKLSLFLFLFVSIVRISACSCISPTLSQKYQYADVIGVMKIVKVYGQDKEHRMYKADIEFETVYKGTAVKTIIVSGRIGKSESAACEIEVKPEERYLIYLDDKSGNDYFVSYCTPKARLSNNAADDNTSYFEYLDKAFSFLETHKSKFNGLLFADSYVETPTEKKSDLSTISDFNPKQQFAIYKIKVNDLSEIQEVTTVAGFDSKDEIIGTILKTKFKVNIPQVPSGPGPKEFLLFFCYDKESIEDPETEVLYSN